MSKKTAHSQPGPALTLDRRTILQAGAALSSASLIGAGAAAVAAEAKPIRFYKVVFDRQHPAAIAFGEEAKAAGLPVQAIGRDVTSLWYDDLYHRWRKGPAAIAGLTPVRVAFCLQMLGQDVGMRMVFRADHAPIADGRLAHAVTGPKSLIDRVALLDTADSWPRGAAKLVSQCPADLSTKTAAKLVSQSASGFAIEEPLVSWIMAPVARA